MTIRNRAGMSIVELLVALAVAGVVLVSTRVLFVGMVAAQDTVVERARSQNGDSNRMRLLRQLVRNTDISGGRQFNGDRSSVQFISLCPSEGGWRERCSVGLFVVEMGDTAALEAEWLGRRERLLNGKAPGRLEYLQSAAGGGEWGNDWSASQTAPLALMVILASDTVFLRIGIRG